VAELNSQERRTEPPDGYLPLAVRQRLHRQVPFALPVIAIVPVVLATTLAPARAGAARMSGRCEAPSRRCCRMTAW
jgi:hypothetical protein